MVGVCTGMMLLPMAAPSGRRLQPASVARGRGHVNGVVRVGGDPPRHDDATMETRMALTRTTEQSVLLDRERELAGLGDRYTSTRAELYALYGRCRVGKTEPLRTFCQDKPSIFFVADLG